MQKQNCWEFKKCGREPGGVKTRELGVCQAAIFALAEGFCGGKNGGRACMYITGTFCLEAISGTLKGREKRCTKCDFYKMMLREEAGKDTVIAFANHINKRRGQI
ncbi:MAG: two-CW domain-containing protein [Candidatus Omnitrophota bacterium]